jgi:acyl-CoA synthetase (AMP-forming)/AMP-acid ligase II
MATIPHPTTPYSPLQRLNQTILQIDPYILPPYPNLSLVSGPLDPPLLSLTLSQLLAQQTALYPSNECLVIPWTGARWTYHHLWEESNLLARALLRYGVRPRDRVGIMAGNCEKYVAAFFACARVGAIFVTLNNTYTELEVELALKKTSMWYLIISYSQQILELWKGKDLMHVRMSGVKVNPANSEVQGARFSLQLLR